MTRTNQHFNICFPHRSWLACIPIVSFLHLFQNRITGNSGTDHMPSCYAINRTGTTTIQKLEDRD